MVNSGKRGLNRLFLGSSIAGCVFILFSDRFVPEAAILLPAAVVFLYGLITGAVLSGCDDRSYADHQMDSVYFLGFLFTLASLITLFYRLYTSALSDDEGLYIFDTFLYAGISVTTSLAGVLCRNLIKSRYLKQHPDSGDEIQKTYEVLRSMAEGFTAGYRETLESIKVFLSEREETTRALATGEKQYIQTLSGLTEGLKGFSVGLADTGRELCETAAKLNRSLREYTGEVDGLRRLGGSFSEAAERIRKEAEGAPFAGVSEELLRFETGTRELNEVLDSLISVLETKVERVR